MWTFLARNPIISSHPACRTPTAIGQVKGQCLQIFSLDLLQQTNCPVLKPIWGTQRNCIFSNNRRVIWISYEFSFSPVPFKTRVSLLKGTVSQKLRPMLLYIIWKLSLKALSTDLQKIFLLKGQSINCIWNSQCYTSICLGKCRVYPRI